jgi:Uma2 family endonuclease
VTVTVTPTLEPIGQVLTPEEYDALPENSLREFVDGVVHVMATPTYWHQQVAQELRAALKHLKPTDLRVTGELEIRLGDNLRRNPDVLVVAAAGLDRGACRVLPEHVVLAIEIVSPGSESTDREIKPHEYARAGIPHYWRVEIDPELVVHTFRLGDRAYVETGVFTSGDVVAAPGLLWARVKVDELTDEG